MSAPATCWKAAMSPNKMWVEVMIIGHLRLLRPALHLPSEISFSMSAARPSVLAEVARPKSRHRKPAHTGAGAGKRSDAPENSRQSFHPKGSHNAVAVAVAGTNRRVRWGRRRRRWRRRRWRRRRWTNAGCAGPASARASLGVRELAARVA